MSDAKAQALIDEFKKDFVGLVYMHSRMCMSYTDKTGPKTIQEVMDRAVLRINCGLFTQAEMVESIENALTGVVEYRPCMTAAKLQKYNIFIVANYTVLRDCIEDLLVTRGYKGVISPGFSIVCLV